MVKPDILIRTKRKTLSLVIDKEGKLIVRAPKRLKLEEIFDFIKQKESWIKKKQASVVNILNANKKLFKYEQVLFLGKVYNVVRVKGIEKPRLDGAYLCIPHKIKEERLKHAIKKWMLSMCEEVILDRIDYFYELMGLQFESAKFVSSKAKWGSCDQNFNLKFNFKLIMLPPKIIDYVILHEFSHILQFNHSPAFWEVVKSIMPSYKIPRKQLKESGFLLSLFT